MAAHPLGPFPYLFLANLAAEGLTEKDHQPRHVVATELLHVPPELDSESTRIIRAAWAKGGFWILSTEDRDLFLMPS